MSRRPAFLHDSDIAAFGILGTVQADHLSERSDAGVRLCRSLIGLGQGWASQWTSGSGEQQAAWSPFRPDGPPADVAVIAGGFANSVERSAAVILEAATHWPEVVVVDGNHEYYDTAEGDRPLDAAYKIWRRALAVAPNVHVVAPGEGWWGEEHNVQFLGANGWYDLEAGPQDRDQQWMLWWRKSVDMRRIDFGGHWPRERAKAEAEALSRDVARATSEPQVGAIVVVTHTQPSRAVLGEYADPNHPDAPHNGAYVSVALEAVPAHDRHGKLKAWLYGHTHTPGRRHVGDIEYVTQPRGFPDERRSRRLPAYRAARVTVTSR